ncbi:hypothetical protein BKM03_27670 [Pseudomonas avellanae]|uniref:Uncharacterized protein n=1 Tax=Pseudomonas avellanae TaxID=46257 RepID=A0AAD0GSQ4_9PSED|nr:hypothetical protein BKM03_27670 [Pseudomonas avellanae]POP85715.1 hypothetical protein CXB34_15700 [Pseudomonas amygdali pv. morsprunorum]
MGCEATLKQVTSVVPDVPHATVLLPVPGSSRANSLPQKPCTRCPCGELAREDGLTEVTTAAERPRTGPPRWCVALRGGRFAGMTQRNQIKTPEPQRLCISRPGRFSLLGFARLRPVS